MTQITQAFLVWLICFGTVSFSALAALHLFLQARRSRSTTTAISSSKSEKSEASLSTSQRLSLVLGIALFYVVLLGPVAGSAVTWLKTASATALPARQASDSGQDQPGSVVQHGGRGVSNELIPVPDPISTK